MSLAVSYPDSFSVEEVTLIKSKPSMKIGLSLKKHSKKASLCISSLSPASPLQGTAIRPAGGQYLVSVNGNAEMPTAATAVDLIAGQSSSLQFLVCDQPTSLCVQVVAAPFFKHSPGITFSSTRGRTLVTISKIMARGSFGAKTDFLHKGDIVLAVNGIPVSKPEEADRALRMPLADGAITVLHTIDVAWLRGLVMNAVDQTKLYKDVTVSFRPDQKDPSQHWMVCQRGQKQNPSTYLEKTFPVEYDRETQHMYDPQPYMRFLSGSGAGVSCIGADPTAVVHKWYTAGACRFMAMFNDWVDANLDGIEENACEHAWRIPQLMFTAPLEQPQRQRESILSLATSSVAEHHQDRQQQQQLAPPSMRDSNVILEEATIYAHPPSAPPIKMEENEEGSKYISC